jgi:methylamine---glutamate N-methyltransferase subunit A
MCGIAGVIYRDGAATSHALGQEMTTMLQSMKHRGPDSTGFALFQPPSERWRMQIKLADANTSRDFGFDRRLSFRQGQVEDQLALAGVEVDSIEAATPYALTTTFDYDGELKELADRIESVSPDVEVLSLGHSLTIVKDLGDAEAVADRYGLADFAGTHAIGHVRMATESDVDISGAHPYWAYPFSDVAVVHNGQLTNYFEWRRRLERSGHRFRSECDSEVIAVYVAERMGEGCSLEEAMKASLEDLDGVFTYICVTEYALGMAKDELAAKPLVLYESDEMVALASEEIAIRGIVDHEIETYDPYEGVVMAWKR